VCLCSTARHAPAAEHVTHEQQSMCGLLILNQESEGNDSWVHIRYKKRTCMAVPYTSKTKNADLVTWGPTKNAVPTIYCTKNAVFVPYRICRKASGLSADPVTWGPTRGACVCVCVCEYVCVCVYSEWIDRS
jgi:hypothetical protein